jgi:hypothetical protein
MRSPLRLTQKGYRRPYPKRQDSGYDRPQTCYQLTIAPNDRSNGWQSAAKTCTSIGKTAILLPSNCTDPTCRLVHKCTKGIEPWPRFRTYRSCSHLQVAMRIAADLACRNSCYCRICHGPGVFQLTAEENTHPSQRTLCLQNADSSSQASLSEVVDYSDPGEHGPGTTST